LWRAARALTDEMSPSKRPRTWIVHIPELTIIWNYFRLRNVHWTGLHIQCSVAVVFNVSSRLPEAVFPLRCANAQHQQTTWEVKPDSRTLPTVEI